MCGSSVCVWCWTVCVCVCVCLLAVCVGLMCVFVGCKCGVCVCVSVCFSLAVPQEMTRWYESCSNNCTFGFFSKNEAEFFGWATNAKLGKYCIHFGVVVWSLMFRYFGHSVRKCSSVSVSPSMQCEQSLSSRESQVCLRRPVSTARLCSLSLYIVNVLLSFTSVTALR